MPLTTDRLPGVGGDCYAAALEYMAVYGIDGVWLAHGEPVGQGPANNGTRFGHAWIEIEGDAGEWYAIEVSEGRHRVFPRDVYYDAGRIAAADVHRYSRDEARDLALEQDSCGPWHREPAGTL